MCATLCNEAVVVLIESRQNLWKNGWEVASMAQWCTTWRGKPYLRRAIGYPDHHTSVSGYAQSRGDQINIQRVGCLSPIFQALFYCGSQHMMGRSFERGAGCLPKLNPGQNAPLWCMQGISTSHTYHLTTRLRQVHILVYVAPLGELCSWSDRQALQLH